MSDQQSIERQEREFTDLLKRVMQAPLSPLADSMQDLNKSMIQLDELVSGVRDIVSVLSLSEVETGKQIRSLKTFSEEIPREIQNVFQPQFEKFQAQLQHLAELNAVVAAGQGAIESSQKQSLEYLENLQQTALAKLFAELESLRGKVGSQLAEQLAGGQRGIMRIQELLNLHMQELVQQSASGVRQLGDEADARISQLTQSISQLRLMLNAQQVQLEHQHAASSKRLGEQMQNGLLSLRKWLIALVCITTASLATVLTIAAGKL